MFASMNNVGFRMIDKAERVCFIDTYDMTPEEFMKRYEEDYSINLDGKYVVAVEGNCEEPDVESGVYSHKILSIYKTRDGQSATLSYHGHISFINVDMGDGKNVLLYKDDECFPQTIKQWYKEECEWRNHNEDVNNAQSIEEFIELINLMIRAEYQNVKMQPDTNDENIIIVQGL